MKQTAALLFTAAAFALPICSADAFELSPFASRNLSPLVQIHGLPFPEGGRLTSPKKTDLLLNLNVASNFAKESRGQESVYLDGETHRIDFSFRRGIRPGFEIVVEIPWIRHSGGFFDRFIDDWHDLLEVSDGGRTSAPSNRLLFTYHDNGREELHLEESAGGIGDVRLTASWSLPWGQSPDSLALRTGLKLPTGDSERLLGSGAASLCVFLDARHETGAMAFFSSGGALLLAKGDILPDKQRNIVGFGSLGAALRPWQRLAFKFQIDGHTPFYNSSLTPLGGSLQLALGGTIAFSEQTTLDLAVIEDIVVASAPDVVFHLALRTRF